MLILNGQTIRDVKGVELVGNSNNPNYAITLNKGELLANNAKLESIRETITMLESQRFFNVFKAIKDYPHIVSVNIF